MLLLANTTIFYFESSNHFYRWSESFFFFSLWSFDPFSLLKNMQQSNELIHMKVLVLKCSHKDDSYTNKRMHLYNKIYHLFT